jgi:hypothetical protein
LALGSKLGAEVGAENDMVIELITLVVATAHDDIEVVDVDDFGS